MALIEPPPLNPFEGTEAFVGLEGTVSDFWRFALPSLQMNNTRGWFAEYLVWRALGIERPVRIEWDAYDVQWGDLRIEVKASAQMQRWAQHKPSALSFTGLQGRLLDAEANTYVDEATYNADIYVLAAHLAVDHDAYRQLDVSQWAFAVVTRTSLVNTGYKSISWGTAQRIAHSTVDFAGLAAAIAAAGASDPLSGPQGAS